MIYIYPINSKYRKVLILKTIANIKKQYQYKENHDFINKKIDKLTKVLLNHDHLVHYKMIEEELELYLKNKAIINIKIDKNFINKIMKLENSFVNTKTLELFILSYIAIEHIKMDNIYRIEAKQIKDLSNDFNKHTLSNIEIDYSLLEKNGFLTDSQYENLLKKYEFNSTVLSKFKQSLAFYFYNFFSYTKEESEHFARHISKSLFNDDKGVNSTRDIIPPCYCGKYIQFR